MPVNASSFPAPSAAAIAAAVAAPSAATIASAVAAAVPTTAGITSIVQANAGSPYGGTWANVALANTQGVSTVTLSSLTGYRYLGIFVQAAGFPTSDELRMRVNGLSTTSTYRSFTIGSGQGQSGNSATSFMLGASSGSDRGMFIEIPNANTSTDKLFKFDLGGLGGNIMHGSGVFTNTAVISSLTFFTSGSSNIEWYIRVFGAN